MYFFWTLLRFFIILAIERIRLVPGLALQHPEVCLERSKTWSLRFLRCRSCRLNILQFANRFPKCQRIWSSMSCLLSPTHQPSKFCRQVLWSFRCKFRWSGFKLLPWGVERIGFSLSMWVVSVLAAPNFCPRSKMPTKPKALEYVGCFWNLQVFDAKKGCFNSWPQWKWMEMDGRKWWVQ